MEKSVKLISIPYDSAHFNKRMGAGPYQIVRDGISHRLRNSGFEVDDLEIVQNEKFPTEVTSTFKLLTLLKDEIRKTIHNQSFPIVLSGNCCATVAVMAEMDPSNTGVIWFDAHGDCETPETTVSGFLDGMGLSMLLNRCWQTLLSTFKLNTLLSGNNVLLVGARNLSSHEKNFISVNNITLLCVDEIRQSNFNAIKAACTKFTQAGIKKVHLHIDVDVIDPSVAIANAYSVNHGLNKNELVQAIDSCLSQIPAASLTIASYDPSFDSNGYMLRIIGELIEKIVKQTQ